MRRPLTAAVLLTLAVTAHAGGIYKCEIDGRTVYQQVACPVGETSSRVQVTRTPASNLTGGLRESEMQALQGILAKQSRQTRSEDTDQLSIGDARHISTAYDRMVEERDGPNRREEENAEGYLRQALGRYDLALEEVTPQLEGETILTRINQELTLRRMSPEDRARFRDERKRMLDAQRAEEQAREAERRARQARMQPVTTTDGTVLIPADPNHNTYTGAAGGFYIRQGNTAVWQ